MVDYPYPITFLCVCVERGETKNQQQGLNRYTHQELTVSRTRSDSLITTNHGYRKHNQSTFDRSSPPSEPLVATDRGCYCPPAIIMAQWWCQLPLPHSRVWSITSTHTHTNIMIHTGSTSHTHTVCLTRALLLWLLLLGLIGGRSQHQVRKNSLWCLCPPYGTQTDRPTESQLLRERLV